MFVAPGARGGLLRQERERFMSEEWPGIRARIDRLGIALDELFVSS